jgi:hypothetical protein
MINRRDHGKWDPVKIGQKVYFGSSPDNSCGKVIFKLFGRIWIKNWDGQIIRMRREWFIMDLKEAIKQKQETIDSTEKYKNDAFFRENYYWNLSQQSRNKQYLNS